MILLCSTLCSKQACICALRYVERPRIRKLKHLWRFASARGHSADDQNRRRLSQNKLIEQEIFELTMAHPVAANVITLSHGAHQRANHHDLTSCFQLAFDRFECA